MVSPATSSAVADIVALKDLPELVLQPVMESPFLLFLRVHHLEDAADGFDQES